MFECHFLESGQMYSNWKIGRWCLIACAIFAIGATPSVRINKPQHAGIYHYMGGLPFDVDGDTDSSAILQNKPTGVLRVALREAGSTTEIWYDTQNITYAKLTTTAYPYCYWPIGDKNGWAGIFINGTLVISTYNSFGITNQMPQMP